MTYQDTHYPHIENVGQLDRVNRMIVALTLVTVTVLFTAITPAAAFTIVVLSIYAGLTAATGWDPLFVIVKAFSQRVTEQGLVPVVSSVLRDEQPTGGDFKKAA